MAKEKRILITVAGSNEEAKELALSPGVTVREALAEASLEDYTLSHKGEPLKPESDLYARVENGDKVEASLSEMAVGLGGFASLYKIPELIRKLRVHIENLVRNILQRIKKQRLPIVKRARLIRVIRIRYPPRTKKARVTKIYSRKAARFIKTSKETEYWQDRGWVKRGDEYRGYFMTDFGRWRGRLEKYRNEFEAFICKPPDFLMKSSHKQCFLYENDGWYDIHFPEVPSDPDSAILAVERVIHEAFKEKKGVKK
jgi:hypothetical protein